MDNKEKEEFEKSGGIVPHLISIVVGSCSCDLNRITKAESKNEFSLDITCVYCGNTYRITTEKIKESEVDDEKEDD